MEREGVNYNKKKLKVLYREGHLYPWKDVFAPLYYTMSPIKTEREGIICHKKN
jgi:hypothetical protein